MRMDGTSIGLALGAALLVFWSVGAHNRLVGLRNALVKAFGPVEQQFRDRQALLEQWLEAVAVQGGEETALAVQTVRAACLQAQGACARAAQRPGAAGAITSLRLADEILADARTKLPAPAGDGTATSELVARLAEADSALVFARRQFNDAVTSYNVAVRQFPTWLLAGLFRFRKAGTL